MRARVLAVVSLCAFLSTTAAFGQSATGPCDAVGGLALAHAKVAVAQLVEAGAFVPPAGTPAPSAADTAYYKTLPRFCRVAVVSTPSADSSIKIEVWMPAAAAGAGAWNGRFNAQGNGGFAGSLFYRGLGQAVELGYATAQTDTGHTGASATDATWAAGHPEKVTDFGYRAVHEMTIVAKAVIKAFYGSGPKHSYFGSCSNGGRQALMEAQRFPDDYDGIIAGAPANAWTRLLTSSIFDAQVLTAGYIPSVKLPAIARAVNAACDAQDGVADGILTDPRTCRFDPATLLCTADETDACLTAPQVTTLRKLYEGATDAKGARVFPGFLPGAEEGSGGWGGWITGPALGRSILFAFGYGFFSSMVYGKPDWQPGSVEVGQALADAQKKAAADLDATDPDLARFKARGGKLILYHGWNDPAISALNTIDYVNAVSGRMGPATDTFLRLYLAPGVQHCGGGPGPDSFVAGPALKDPRHSLQLSLEQWVEKGSAPGPIVATKFQGAEVKMTRPLCPYPQVAQFKGGDPNDAASFACAAPAAARK
jgi:hypothetical protein